MTLDTTTAAHDAESAFVVTPNGTLRAFDIEDDAFAAWVDSGGDELGGELPDSSNDYAGSALSDLVYEALSAGVLSGDPAIELNVHESGAGYLVRFNNAASGQQLVGLTRGWHELRCPPSGLTPAEEARYYLQQICDVANALLNDLPGPL
jgi:hypothetical protein